jgi:hypothetical protein
MIGESRPIKEADNDQTFVGSEGAERRRENNGASGERNGIGGFRPEKGLYQRSYRTHCTIQK